MHHHPNCTKQQELTSRIKGAVVPTCEPSGTYTPLQCNATTGVCYCMLSYGDVLPDTVLPMVKGTPYCWHLRNGKKEKKKNTIFVIPESLRFEYQYTLQVSTILRNTWFS